MKRRFLAALGLILISSKCEAQGLTTYDIAESDFNQKVIADSTEQPVVVMFRSDRCSSCTMMTIQTPQAAFSAFAGKLKFYTINIDTERAIAQKYRVTDVPRIDLFKNGEPAASHVGALEKNPLFQFFATYAAPEAKQAYQKPAALELKRLPGADAKMIGSWEIQRSADGVAYGLQAIKYVRSFNETQVGPWRVSGSAGLSLRYDAEKQYVIWDVDYSQDITRPSKGAEDGDSTLQATGAKIVIGHPGSFVSMKLDGELVATLPDPLTLRAQADAKAVKAGERTVSKPSGRFYFVVANQYLGSSRYGNLTPAQFEKLFIEASTVQFTIIVDGQSVVLSEIALEETGRAIAYLKGEREYDRRKRYNATTVPK